MNEAVNSRKGARRYERRPQRKIRNDRNEYKGHDRRANPECPKKKKTAKQSRKQTLSHDFHAPNMSQTRLTVCADCQPFEVVANSVLARFSSEHGDIRQRTNVLPIKSRECRLLASGFIGPSHKSLVPDLTFSEMNFLSRRSRLNLNELPAEEQQDKINKATRRERDSETQVPQYFNHYYDEVPSTVYADADQSAPLLQLSVKAIAQRYTIHLV